MLNTLATGAPDLWVQPGEIEGSSLAYVFATATILAVFALVLTLCVIVDGDKGAVWAGLASLVLTVTAIATFSAMTAEHDAAVAARDAETDGYADEVCDWLDDSYGINVSDDAIWRLIDGETLATDYDGDRIVISFTTTSDDELALIDENLALVPELTR